MKGELTFTSRLNAVPLGQRQTIARLRTGHCMAGSTSEAAVRIDWHRLGDAQLVNGIRLHERRIPRRIIKEQIQVFIFARGHSVVGDREVRTRFHCEKD